jgi:hypothetical protein
MNEAIQTTQEASAGCAQQIDRSTHNVGTFCERVEALDWNLKQTRSALGLDDGTLKVSNFI